MKNILHIFRVHQAYNVLRLLVPYGVRCQVALEFKDSCSKQMKDFWLTDEQVIFTSYKLYSDTSANTSAHRESSKTWRWETVLTAVTCFRLRRLRQSVCLSRGRAVQNDWTDRHPVWGEDSWHRLNVVIDGGPHSSQRGRRRFDAAFAKLLWPLVFLLIICIQTRV